MEQNPWYFNEGGKYCNSKSVRKMFFVHVYTLTTTTPIKVPESWKFFFVQK